MIDVTRVNNCFLLGKVSAHGACKRAKHAEKTGAVKAGAFATGKSLSGLSQEISRHKTMQRFACKSSVKPCFPLFTNSLFPGAQPLDRHVRLYLAENGSGKEQRVFPKAYRLDFELLRQPVAIEVDMRMKAPGKFRITGKQRIEVSAACCEATAMPQRRRQFRARAQLLGQLHDRAHRQNAFHGVFAAHEGVEQAFGILDACPGPGLFLSPGQAS